MNQEELVFTIISEAGNAKSVVFEALALAKEGKFNEAKSKIKEAEENFNKAHDIQTDLITKEVRGEKNEVGILMVHAQDHLSSATLAKDLIEEMIEMQKQIQNISN